MKERKDFGAYLQKQRIERGLPLRVVAEKLSIDLTTLSKIEHGERQIQSHMLLSISEIFQLNYKELQIKFLNHRITASFGNEPYFIEALDSIRK